MLPQLQKAVDDFRTKKASRKADDLGDLSKEDEAALDRAWDSVSKKDAAKTKKQKSGTKKPSRG